MTMTREEAGKLIRRAHWMSHALDRALQLRERMRKQFELCPTQFTAAALAEADEHLRKVRKAARALGLALA